MASNTSNITHYLKSEDWMFVPAPHCIPWLAVLGTVCLAIVILNSITIIMFAKQRRLQRKSTYLVIHLAIVDLLIGAVTGPLRIESLGRFVCHLWENDKPNTIMSTAVALYHIDKVSLLNLAFISLERTHATFSPFKHRFVKKWVYGVVIVVTWLVPVVMISMVSGGSIPNHDIIIIFFWVYFLYTSILLLVIFACYISIYIKVRGGRFAQLHGAAGLRERKLTSTMFHATFGSFLTFLLSIVCYGVFVFDLKLLLSLSINFLFHFQVAMITFLLFNSLLNPIIYAIKMPEFRAGMLQIIFRRSPRRPHPVNIPLQGR